MRTLNCASILCYGGCGGATCTWCAQCMPTNRRAADADIAYHLYSIHYYSIVLLVLWGPLKLRSIQASTWPFPTQRGGFYLISLLQSNGIILSNVAPNSSDLLNVFNCQLQLLNRWSLYPYWKVTLLKSLIFHYSGRLTKISTSTLSMVRDRAH